MPAMLGNQNLLQDQRSLFQIRCRLESSEEQTRQYRLFGGFDACTYYEYDLSAPPVTDPVWGGETPYGGNGIPCNYHWLEGVIGIDAKIWGPVVWVGVSDTNAASSRTMEN